MQNYVSLVVKFAEHYSQLEPYPWHTDIKLDI